MRSKGNKNGFSMEVRPVTLTERAKKEVISIMKKKGIPKDYLLRVGIKGGGCGTMGHVIGFDTPEENDLRYSVGGFDILVSKSHTMYLFGTKVDFIDSAEARGFCFSKELG